MIRWSAFAIDEPELAAWASERLLRPPAFLATVRADGTPRVHPVTPVLTPDGLYVFMEPTSPKGADLRVRRAFALHNGVRDTEGTGGELFVSGEGVAIDDPEVRAVAVGSSSYEPADRYVLFELLVGAVGANGYGDVELPAVRRWKATA
jgi:hypothetical protein